MGQADAEYHEKMMRLAQRPFTPEEEQDAMPEPLSRSDTPPDPPEPRRPMPEPLSPAAILEAVRNGDWQLPDEASAAFFDLLAALDAERAKNERLEAAHERCCDETDYCYVCDNHPSHGHAADCLLAEREVQE